MRAVPFDTADSGRAAIPLSAIRRLLVVFPGYVAPVEQLPFSDAGLFGNVLVRGLAAIRSPAMRQHVRFYRDYYANPRVPAYMREMLDRLFADSPSQARTLLVGPGAEIDPGTVHWADEVRRVDESFMREPFDLTHLGREHDAALLVHADALGLGLGAFERSLAAAFPGHMFVLNGRRRLYRLDARMRRRLGRRRVLAETRIVEAALARLVRVAAWLLAARDLLPRKLT
jgi:hypothetical protein